MALPMMMTQEEHAFKCSYIWSTSHTYWLEQLMEILVIGPKTITLEAQGSFESTSGLKVHNLPVSLGRDGQIPMAVLHFSFPFNTLLERCLYVCLI